MAASLQPIEGSDWVGQSRTLLAHAIAAAHLHDAQGEQAAAQSIEALTEAHSSMRTGDPRASVPDEIRAWVLANCKNASGAALKDMEYAQAAMK